MDDNLIPLFGIFCVFGLPVLALIVIRAMHHRERIEMIRHGVVPPPKGRHWREWEHAAQMPPPPVQHAPFDHDQQHALRRGITLAFIGLALTIGLSFINLHRPGPWLLAGLIPMFIGLAQVLTALLFGAQFPSAAARFTVAPGAPQGAAAPPPPPPFEGAYTYRPDPNQPEIGRSNPPDRR